MNSRFLSTVTRALRSSTPRQCQQHHISPLRMSRSYASSRDLEREILGVDNSNVSSSAKGGGGSSSSPLSAVTQTINRSSRQRGDASLAGKYESLQDDYLPYATLTPAHHMHVYAHKHNTILTLTRPNGEPMMSMGCGRLGFRKAGRSGYDPAYQLASHVFAQIQEKGWLPLIQQLEVVYRGFGPGRDAFNKVLLGNEGRYIRGLVCRVTDSTRIKFGGTRSRKARRLG